MLELFVDYVILRASDKMFNVARFESRKRPQNFSSFNSSTFQHDTVAAYLNCVQKV